MPLHSKGTAASARRRESFGTEVRPIPLLLVSLLLVPLLLLVLTACSPQNNLGSSNVDSAADAELNAFLDDVFERRVSESPIQQSRLGRKTDQLGEWDDFTDAYSDRQMERISEDLNQLESKFGTAELSDSGGLSYELFRLNLNQQLANDVFRRQFYVVDQFNGQVSSLLTVLQNNHPIASSQDAENYLRRIGGLGEVLSVLAGQFKDRAELGVIPPAFSFPAMIADVSSMARVTPIEDNPLLVDFKAKISGLDLNQEAEEQLVGRAIEALVGPYSQGFQQLLAELKRVEPLAVSNGNKGVWSLPEGEAFYANRVAAHTTLDLSADEIHEIGLADVARIHKEMAEIQDQVEFEGTLQDFFKFIREDPNNYYEDSDAGREEFLRDAQRDVDEIYEGVGEFFKRLPKAELEVRRVEPWRENSTSIAFYNSPSEDGTRPGIYYANLADMKSVQKYVFNAITYHESVPGHHFQIALAQEIEGLPKFRRFGGYNAFTEGWALYAERLAKEMGAYQDPYFDFGRLQDEIWRSVRLVVDTGIHSKRWTRQEAIDYFLFNTPISEGDIVTEVERYFVNPGQALGYKMGMIKIVELRAKAESELGSDFDIRDFHEVVIGKGSVTLPVLERQVNAYIDRAGE